jgi:hypothetical protein
MARLDIIDFRREIINRPITEEVEVPTEVEVRMAVKDPATGEIKVETRLEPRMTKKEVKRLIQEEKEFVEYAAVGRRAYATVVKTINEIRAIRDPEMGEEDNEDKAALAANRDFILAAHAAWKQGHEMPAHGTPLGAWPAINARTSEAFKLCGVRTVEEIAELSELARPRVAHIGDIPSLIKQAKLFLASADKLATANSMKALEDANSELKEQVAEQARLMEEMRRMMVEMQDTKPLEAKPRRGRPPSSERLAEDAA